jgi:hypothetical protein
VHACVPSADIGQVFTVIALLSATVALFLVIRWVLVRVDSLGRTRSFPAISFGAALVVSLATGIPVVLHARMENELARVASDIVGFPVTVQCKTLGQSWIDAHTELGYVPFGPDGVPEHETVLDGQACEDVDSWRRSDHEVLNRDQVIAVHVLTHEAMHMAGIVNEAAAECAAMQRDVRTARALGASREQARELARYYWDQVYPQMPDEYRSSECAPGGELDEGLVDAPWD